MFSKFYRLHYDLVSNFYTGFGLKQGLSEPEFYGNLVYKCKKIVGVNDFSDYHSLQKNWIQHVCYATDYMLGS